MNIDHNNNENISIIFETNQYKIYVDNIKNTLFIDIFNATYNKDLFFQGLEYIKNFWILANQNNKSFYQVFIFREVKLYPFELYENLFNTLKQLEQIFKINLYGTCIVNDSNLIDIFKPLFSMYKTVRPFQFVKTLDEGLEFIYKQSLPNTGA